MNKEFEVNGVKYLAVEMPDGLNSFYYDKEDYSIKGRDINDRWHVVFEVMGYTGWEIVGLVRELFNDNCKKIFSNPTVWYSTERGTTVEGTIPIDHIETPLMKFDKLRKEHNLNDNHLILKEICTNI